MPRSDPHVPMYELPHSSHVWPVRVCHEVVSVEKYTITCYSLVTSGNSQELPRLNKKNRARLWECWNVEFHRMT